MASLLVDCWEGAALRSRLRGNAAPLTTMLDFYFPIGRNAPTAIVDRPRRTPDAVGSEYSPPPVEKA